eukprot:TRINITY_DN8356_c0_g1_i1.p1 TRINITY_DN8356_c0_g1~~TRINITY_DN8356_c0_g1_i1.p1  ORF type:complete len:360 (+),score=41.25 TRINITY_DN8356_c0_g1_i1:124-1203(+)
MHWVKLMTRPTRSISLESAGHCIVETVIELTDGTIVTGFSNGSIKRWDFLNGSEQNGDILMRTYLGHTQAVLSLLEVRSTNQSQGPIFFLSGSFDRTIKIWNAETEVCVSTYTEHQDGVTCCMTIPSHPSLILSGSYDESLILWQVSSGHHQQVALESTQSFVSATPLLSFIQQFNTGQPISTLCSIESGWIVSGSTGSLLRLWKFAKEEREDNGEFRWVIDLNNEQHYGDYNSGYLQTMIELWPNTLVLCTPRSRLECWDYGKTPPLKPKRTHLLAGFVGHTLIVKVRSTMAENETTKAMSVIGGYSGQLQLWDDDEATCVLDIKSGSTARVSAVLQLSNGQLVSAQDSIFVWNLQQR